MLSLALAILLAPQDVPQPTFPATAPQPAIRLWAGDAPGARGSASEDVPTLTPYLAPDALVNGSAVVVLPGGGYGGLAAHEGEGYARWLNGLGIQAFVCRYRLGSHGYRHPCMLQDAARAVRLVRERACEWDVDPARVGVIGSSAGGHLASTLLTWWDLGDPQADDPVERRSSRPDLGILCYPVIDMHGAIAHRGSRRNLLGDDPGEDLELLLSTQLRVDRDTPPTFLWHTAADAGVSVRNSYAFADALATAGVQHELHVYAEGRHGLGLGPRDPAGRRADELLPWTGACAAWLASNLGAAPLRSVLEEAVLLEMRQHRQPAPGPVTADGVEGGPVTVVARVGDVVALRREDAWPDPPAGASVRWEGTDGSIVDMRIRAVRGGLLLARMERPGEARDLRAGRQGRCLGR